MSFLQRYGKKILYLIITGSTSVFIAACYGIPANYSFLGNWTVKTKNNENKPIEGLEVTILQYSEDSDQPVEIGKELTDSTGTASFVLSTDNKAIEHNHKAVIRDIDGDANGGAFKDTVIIKGTLEESTIQMESIQ